MFTKHLVTKELLPVVHRMFREVFPDEKLYEDGSCKDCFAGACDHEQKGRDVWHYYLWKLTTPDDQEGKFIAMSGIYTEEADPDSLWLGWMGVLPEYRRERLATRILNDFLRECRGLGFKYARIYTNEDNEAARACYRFNGFAEEKYGGETPEYILFGGPVWVYSRSAISPECPPWNDRKLNF